MTICKICGEKIRPLKEGYDDLFRYCPYCLKKKSGGFLYPKTDEDRAWYRLKEKVKAWDEYNKKIDNKLKRKVKL